MPHRAHSESPTLNKVPVAKQTRVNILKLEQGPALRRSRSDGSQRKVSARPLHAIISSTVVDKSPNSLTSFPEPGRIQKGSVKELKDANKSRAKESRPPQAPTAEVTASVHIASPNTTPRQVSDATIKPEKPFKTGQNPLWMPDSSCKTCYDCQTPFSFFVRRHHCRFCGQIFCFTCSSRFVDGSAHGLEGTARSCRFCYSLLAHNLSKEPEKPTFSQSLPASPLAGRNQNLLKEGSRLTLPEVEGYASAPASPGAAHESRSLTAACTETATAATPSHIATFLRQIGLYSEVESTGNEQATKKSTPITSQDGSTSDQATLYEHLRKSPAQPTRRQSLGWKSLSQQQLMYTESSTDDSFELMSALTTEEEMSGQPYSSRLSGRDDSSVLNNSDIDRLRNRAHSVVSADDFVQDQYLSPADSLRELMTSTKSVFQISAALSYASSTLSASFSSSKMLSDSLVAATTTSAALFMGTKQGASSKSTEAEEGTGLANISTNEEAATAHSSVSLPESSDHRHDLRAKDGLQVQTLQAPKVIFDRSKEALDAGLAAADAFLGHQASSRKDGDSETSGVVSEDLREECKNMMRIYEENHRLLSSMADKHLHSVVSKLVRCSDALCGSRNNQEIAEAAISKWTSLIVSVAKTAATNINPYDLANEHTDLRRFIKVMAIAGGDIADSRYISGIVFRKNVAHKKMPKSLKRPRIVLIGSGIDRERVDTRLSSLDALIEQENAYTNILVSKVLGLKPDLLIVGRGVSRQAQENKIVLILNVKLSVMQRIARQTGATILDTAEHINVFTSDCVGQCESFDLRTFDVARKLSSSADAILSPLLSGRVKAVMTDGEDDTFSPSSRLGKNRKEAFIFLEGCRASHGGTIFLRGGNETAMWDAKQIALYTVFVAYNLRHEVGYLSNAYVCLENQLPSAAADGDMLASSSLQETFNDVDLNSSDFALSSVRPGQLSKIGKFCPALRVSVGWMRLTLSGQEAGVKQCYPSEIKDITCYSDTDRPLGLFLHESCFDLNSRCANAKCKGPISSHVQTFAHKNAQVLIYTEKLQRPIAEHHDESPKESKPGTKSFGMSLDAMIWMWRYCQACRQVVSPIVPMTRECWRYSFAKVLEVLLFNQSLRAVSQRCKHEARVDHVQYFACGASVACMRTIDFSAFSVRSLKTLSVNINMHQQLIAQRASWLQAVSTSVLEAITQKRDMIERLVGANLELAMPEALSEAVHKLRDLGKEIATTKDILNAVLLSIAKDDEANHAQNSAVDRVLSDARHPSQRNILLDNSTERRVDVIHRSFVMVMKEWNARLFTLYDVIKQHGTFLASNIPALQSSIPPTSKAVSAIHENSAKPVSNDGASSTPDDDSLSSTLPDSKSSTVEKAGAERAGGVDLQRQLKMWSQQQANSVCAVPLPECLVEGHLGMDLGFHGEAILVYQDEPATLIAYSLSSEFYNLELERLTKLARTMQTQYSQRNATKTSTLTDPPSGATPPARDGRAGGVLAKNEFERLGYATMPEAELRFCLELQGVEASGESESLPSSQQELSLDKQFVAGCTEVQDPLLMQHKTHIKHKYYDTATNVAMNGVASNDVHNVRFTCHTYWASQFASLRRHFGVGNIDFVSSLALSSTFRTAGGKSGAVFSRTFDERFIVKQITRTELQMFLEFAPAYFEYMYKVLVEQLPSALAKILGVYEVAYHDRNSGQRSISQVIVMENVFYNQRIHKVFDLKGNTRNRLASSDSPVLLDVNFVQFTHGSPFPLQESSYLRLQRSLWNDSLFLSVINVVDYSILVGMDASKKMLAVGVIDYLRQYDFVKRVETLSKSVGMIAGQAEPTIIHPDLYATRFRTAMERYFMSTPTAISLVHVPNEAKVKFSSHHSAVM